MHDILTNENENENVYHVLLEVSRICPIRDFSWFIGHAKEGHNMYCIIYCRDYISVNSVVIMYMFHHFIYKEG